MACNNPLTHLFRECGKNTAAGLRDDVYLVPFEDLKVQTGSTEVYTSSVSGLISGISFNTGSTKFVKYGAVKNQNGLTDTFTQNENGSFDVQKELTFSISNTGSVDAKKAVENLIANPVVALVRQKSGSWVIAGLNGQFSMTTAAGENNSSANGRVITLAGSDTEFWQIVDPTIIGTLLAA